MSDVDRQFWQTIRSFLIRYTQYNRQKGASAASLQQFQITYSRFLYTRQLKEVVINKITSIETKSDYHNLILLALLQDLTKWSSEHYQNLKIHPGPLQCILNQSITIINGQQQYHTIVPKQNQLIAGLLTHTYTLNHIDQYKILYRRLKDIKEFYPSAIRDHQKQLFLKAIQESVEKAASQQNIIIIEFLFNNIFAELQMLGDQHQYIFPRLKILKKLIKSLWIFHQDILYRSAYLIMKYSYEIVRNKQLFNHVLPLYQVLLSKLIAKPSIVPLIIYKHVVISNITKIFQERTNFILLQALLSEVKTIFQQHYLQYFMKNYDWNYLESPICQQSLSMLYQYTQNRMNQKRIQFQLSKNYIARIYQQIKQQLQNFKNVKYDQSKWKFYQLKKKQCQQLLQLMNEKPKKIFKQLEQIKNAQIRQNVVLKYVKMIKKSSQLNPRSMIDIFSTDNPFSAQLFSSYVEIVLKQCKEHNLEEFMRLFTSNFFLTGQSQQIARVMDTITQLFYKFQPEESVILKSSDATYTFANAILILNTDLHNPKNQNKISQQDFIKMCKKINQGQDLPLQVIKSTYSNIKKNKINTFRDRSNMFGISVNNWLLLCYDYASLPITYYDNQLQLLDENCLKYFIGDILTTIIDQKQTNKLEILVQRFKYDDKIYQCQIIQIIRKVVQKKIYLPAHILQKILQLANFKNSKLNEKLISYYWLACHIILNFSQYIATNVICQFLMVTWIIRQELQDNLYLRQTAQIRRVKQSIKYIAKRQSKKSIMDMFSNFLSFKESDDESQIVTQFSKRINFKSLSHNIFDIIKHSTKHKISAFEFLTEYIHNQESKLYEQFLSCLFLIFNTLYNTQSCQRIAQDLFYELLGLKESAITVRLNNLAKKDNKLFKVLDEYCKFWILKLLLKEYNFKHFENTQNNSYAYLFKKASVYLQIVSKQMLLDLVRQIQDRDRIHKELFEQFDKTIKKIYTNDSQKEEVQFFYNRFAGNKENQEKKEAFSQSKTVKQDLKSIDNIEASLQISQTNASAEKIEHKQIEQNQQTEVKQAQPDKHIKESQQIKVEQNIERLPESAQVENKNQESELKNQQVQEEISQKQIIKRKSIQNLEYINPDAVIQQIEHQIEEHLKQPVLIQQMPKNDVQKDEKEQQDSRQKSPVTSDKEEESAPYPIVMF